MKIIPLLRPANHLRYENSVHGQNKRWKGQNEKCLDRNFLILKIDYLKYIKKGQFEVHSHPQFQGTSSRGGV